MVIASNQSRMSVSRYIAEELYKLKVLHIFGYQGANITYMIDAIAAHPGLQYVQTSHEQGAAFAANGYAQASSNIGAAVSSGGPGALNLITGIANAYCDSIPTLFICGDLSRRYKKNALPMRQDGFQSTDIVSIVSPVTKYSVQIESPDDVRYCLERAVFESISGRKGPSLISIPHWIQRAEIDPLNQRSFFSEGLEIASREESISLDVINVLGESCRPLILLGGGCANQETRVALEKFLMRNPLPLVASLCGLGAISHDHPSYIGFIGDYGHRHANLALAASDCLIVLGSRMDERQVGFLQDKLEKKIVIHVDIDPSELLPNSDRYFPVLGTASNFLNALEPIVLDVPNLSKWKSDLMQLKEKYPVHQLTQEFSPSSFLSGLFEMLAPEAQVYVDVGLHQMCTAQFGILTNGKQLYWSGGLGSMGYALPASIGGHLARSKRQTICIAGDGGLMMSISELQTIIRDNLDVKIVVMNNHCLGMVRNHQLKAFSGRTIGAIDGYLAGDFNKIAKAFNIEFFRIGDHQGVEILDKIFHKKGPALIEVVFPGDMMPFPHSVDYPLDGEVF